MFGIISQAIKQRFGYTLDRNANIHDHKRSEHDYRGRSFHRRRQAVAIAMATIKLQRHLTMPMMMMMAGYRLKIAAIGMITKTVTTIYIVIDS